jgi:hypothetical protein
MLGKTFVFLGALSLRTVPTVIGSTATELFHHVAFDSDEQVFGASLCQRYIWGG